MLVKNNIIMKRGDDEAAQIRYVSITKNSQGLEEIEVQGKFLIAWIGKRIIKKADYHERHNAEHSIPYCTGERNKSG